MNEKYCRECGCEIRSDDDLGCEDIEREYRPIFVGCSEFEIIERPFYVCRSCMEEEERQWKDFFKTPEGQYECAFMQWCKAGCPDVYPEPITQNPEPAERSEWKPC